MSSDEELSSDNENNFEEDVDFFDDESESSEEEETLSAEDICLFNAIECNDVDAGEAVQQAIRDGANVNAVRNLMTPLLEASMHDNAEIVDILLGAGADARWRDPRGWSAITQACWNGHLSTVQLLINHDNGLLETVDDQGWTPLLTPIFQQRSDIVQFLLNQGANAHCVDDFGETALMIACQFDNLDNVRLLLAAGVDVEARDESQRTALHHAAINGRIETMLELILQHSANMFAVDRNGLTPFDLASRLEQNADVLEHLLEIYGNKLSQDHGSIALHELLKVAQYSFAEDEGFHPPLNPLQILLPLGKLTLEHFRILLLNLDPELFRNRDNTGQLPIHIACRTNSPMEVLALILELDSAALHISDYTGALPIHLLCGTTAAATEYASVRYLVEQGGVGTLAARDRQGLLPLHVLCESTNPPLRVVQYLIQSFPGSVAVHTKAGQYPFMVAASDSSLASLSVIYELVRANPGLVVPR